MDHSAYTAPSSNISRSKYPEEVDLIGDHCATRENGKAGLGLLDLPLEGEFFPDLGGRSRFIV